MTAATDPLRRRPARLKAGLALAAIAVPILLGLTALLTLLLIGAIWPGEAKLFEPILCSDTHPDAYVVSDTYQSTEGTSVDFTVYCVASDGDAVNVGWARAWLLAWALHTVLVLAILGGLLARAVARRRRAQADNDPGTGGPTRHQGPGEHHDPIITLG